MMVEETELFDSYKRNFDLIHNSNFTLNDIENMLPFEREVYIHLHNEAQQEKGP